MASVSLYGKSTIRGSGEEYETEYMTRYWFWRFRFHIFYRGDQDPDCHDHPWSFVTIPFVPYVEEVLDPLLASHVNAYGTLKPFETPQTPTRRQVVKAWRPHFREAEHAHRVLGAYSGRTTDLYSPDAIDHKRSIYTIVFRGRDRLNGRWGFFMHRGVDWCKAHWRTYSKHAPCE